MSKELVKQDINFLEYPLWFQDKYVADSQNGYTWEDSKGFLYKTAYKAPVKVDLLFLLSLLLKSQNDGWRSEVKLSRFELLKSCDFGVGKFWYERLEESLERWRMVGIKFKGTFYDGTDYLSMSFGIIDAWTLDKKTKVLTVYLSSFWLEHIKQSRFFEMVDFKQIKSLRSPLVIRLYELLAKTFRGRDIWKIDALKLAEKIPMKEEYPAHIVPKIVSAVKRICEKTDLIVDLEVDKSERGKALLIFRKKNPESKLLSENVDTSESLFALEGEMLSLLPEKEREKKTTLSVLKNALETYDPEYVERNILYTNKFAKKSYRVYLEKALKEDWARFWWDEQLQEKTEQYEVKKHESKEHIILPNCFATQDEAEEWLKGRLAQERKSDFFGFLKQKMDDGYVGRLEVGGYSKDVLENFIFQIRSKPC